jgi:2-oxoglutarate ferredoxin oxidoreductase subunit gamma
MTELRIAGFGGQGVILAGMVIGRAATIYDNKFVTLTQSFGPEARGSACSVQLIVSPEPVLYPYITRPEILVVMSQEACSARNPFPTSRPSESPPRAWPKSWAASLCSIWSWWAS